MFLFMKLNIEDNWEHQHFLLNLTFSNDKSIRKQQVGLSKNRYLYLTIKSYEMANLFMLCTVP